MKNSKPLQKELVSQFYRGNKLFFAAAAFNALISSSLNLILSWLLQQIIDATAGIPNALGLDVLAKICAGFILFCAVTRLIGYASEPRFIERALRQYKDFAFRKLTEKSISSFCDENTAVYLSALSNDVNSIEADYLAQQFSLITSVVTFLGALAMMLLYSPLMTAISAGLTVLPLAASVLTGNRLAPAERRVSDRNAAFTSSLKDCLGGFSLVKSFQAEKEIFELFARNNRSLEHEKFTKRRIKIIIGMIGSVTGVFAQLGVFLAGAYLALSGQSITPGTVIAFVNLMNFMIQPVAELPGLLASRRAASGLIGKLAAALEKNICTGGTAELTQLNSGISLKNVSFGYDGNREVLHQITAEFEAGKCYAVVGGSGSGKSTLLNLIMAADTDYRGEILYDGTELRQISTAALYELISVIQQNVFVFHASVRDNITMFRKFPEQEVEEAIRQAHLKEVIQERGDSYLCGENGQGLSGGEKQRISIARSLLKKSSVLLADEATASLDAQTAFQVSGDILKLNGITRIVVTHSLNEALLRQYDGIFALKDGRIAESGTFEDLIARKGYFYALYTVSQA